MTKPQVLVADDDRAIRESLTRALELEGYEVVAVSDGADALRPRRTAARRAGARPDDAGASTG